MLDRDEFFESRIRGIAAHKIKSPGLKKFKPWRFEAGSGKGGQFAPKGVGSTSYKAISRALDADLPRVVNPDAPFEDIDDYMRPARKYGPPRKPDPVPVTRHVMRPDKIRWAPRVEGRVGRSTYRSKKGIEWNTPESGVWWTDHQRAVYSIRPDPDGYTVQIEGRGAVDRPIHKARSLPDAIQWVDANHSRENAERWKMGEPVKTVDVRPYGSGIWRIEDSTSGAMTPENARAALRDDAVFQRLIKDVADNPSRLRAYTDADGNPTYDGGQRAYVEWYESPRTRRDPSRTSIYTADKAAFAQALIDGVMERRRAESGGEPVDTPDPSQVARRMLFGRSGSGRAVGAMPIYAFGRDDGMASGDDFARAAAFIGDAGALRADAAQWLKVNPDASGPGADAIRNMLSSSQAGRDFLRDVYGRKFGTKTWSGIVRDAQDWVSANPGVTGPEAEQIQRLAQGNKADRGIWKGIAARGLRGGYVAKRR